MLVSRQAGPERFDPLQPQQAFSSQAHPTSDVEFSEVDLEGHIAAWSIECEQASDLSGFARQHAFLDTIHTQQLDLDFQLNPTEIETTLWQQRLDLVHLAFAKLLSVYAGHAHVCFASLNASPQSAQPDWLLRHCNVQLDEPSSWLADASPALPLHSIAHRLQGQKLWGASLSTHFDPAKSSSFHLDQLPLPSTSFHLHLSLLHHGPLRLQAVFAPDTFLDLDAQQICKRFAHLLQQLHQGVRARDLDLFVPGEQQLILQDYSHSQQQRELDGYPASHSPTPLVHELISRAAQRFGSFVALHAPSSAHVTYQQLGTVSDRLASQLRRLQVQPEVHVALMLDKTELLPISILAVLKAGGCVTPLVNQLTDDKISYILAQTQSAVWIVDHVHRQRAERILASLQCSSTPQLLCVGKEIHTSHQPLPDLVALRDVPILPTTKAYTIYTSGTTGLPKAVILEHRNLAAFATAKVPGWNPGRGSRLLQFSAPIWDVSLGDFIYGLTTGATLVLQDRFSAIADIDATIQSLGITHAILTPTVADFVRQKHSSLEALILTGESVPLAQRNRLLQLVPALINGGAPSEVTILALMNRLQSSEANLRWTPFGKPIGSVHSVIVDANGAVVPLGAVGELCLAGQQVSRGYLNQPEKTAAAFVHLDVASSMPALAGQSRFYRTGDLAKLHADGRFELMGRIDAQLKYRGVRLEAQEVEGAIQLVDQLVQGAFVCTKDIKGTQRLVALIRYSDNSSGTTNIPGKTKAEELAKQLCAQLGTAITPNTFIFAATDLPLTVSGKLDRKAAQIVVDRTIDQNQLHLVSLATLNKQQRLRQIVGAVAAARPHTKAQVAVAEAYAAALELDAQQINVNETMQELGGDSLTAVRILTSLRKQNFRVEIRDLLEDGGTVASVASRLSFDTNGSGPLARSVQHKVDPKLADLSAKDRHWVLWRYAIDPDWIDDMFYSTPYQSTSAGMGFAFKLPRPQSVEWNQAVWECRGRHIHADDLRSAWMTTVQHHPTFRSAMTYSSTFEGVVCVFKTRHCPFQLKTLYPRSDVEHDRDLHTYMDEDRLQGHERFGRVPFRLALIGATANRPQRLIIAFPHSLACGWSMRLMLKTLLGILNGKALVETTSTTYKEYVAFTRSRDLEQLDLWWKEELNEMPLSTWPINYKENPQVYPVVNRQFDAYLPVQTKQLARSLGASLFSVCMGAFVLALHRRSRAVELNSRESSHVQVATSYSKSS